jgi:hypothetical protein
MTHTAGLVCLASTVSGCHKITLGKGSTRSRYITNFSLDIYAMALFVLATLGNLKQIGSICLHHQANESTCKNNHYLYQWYFWQILTL